MALRNHLPENYGNRRPFRDLARMQRDFDRMFEQMFEEFPGFVGESQEFFPACDIEETDSHYWVAFDLPGVSKNDLKIEVRDRQLYVSGERKKEHKEREGLRLSEERHYGSFQRVFTLPSAAKLENIEANFESGVLYIAIPKAEATKPKQVEIKEHAGGIFNKLLGREKEIPVEKGKAA